MLQIVLSLPPKNPARGPAIKQLVDELAARVAYVREQRDAHGRSVDDPLPLDA
jgi:hypothetical protein